VATSRPRITATRDLQLTLGYFVLAVPLRRAVARPWARHRASRRSQLRSAMNWFEAPAPLFPEIVALHGKWLATSLPSWMATGLLLARFDARTNAWPRLQQLGLRRRARLVVMHNSAEMLEAIWGVLKAARRRAAQPVDPGRRRRGDGRRLRGVAAVARATSALASSAAPAARHRTDRRIRRARGGDPGWRAFGEWRDSQPAHAPEPGSAMTTSATSSTARVHRPAEGHRAHPPAAARLGVRPRPRAPLPRRRPHAVLARLYSNISWVGFLCTMLAGAPSWCCAPSSRARCSRRCSASASRMAPCAVQFQRLLERPTSTATTGLAAQPDVLRLAAGACAQGRGDPASRLRADRAVRAHRGRDHDARPEDVERKLASVASRCRTDLRILGPDDREVPRASRARSSARAHPHGCYHARPDARRGHVDDPRSRWLRTGDVGASTRKASCTSWTARRT